MAGLYAQTFETTAKFFSVDSSVNEEAGALSLEQSAVARAS